MPKLNEVLAAAKEATIDANGVPVDIVYDPNVYTPEAEAEWMEAEKLGQSPGDLAADFLSRLLSRWDMQEDDGSPMPITSARLRKLPFAFLMQIMDGISEDLGKGRNREEKRAQKKKRT